ncbi:Uncharacterised protein [Dermatophilus congolensis]|uniref:Uncharacterized protein n=2 Tax=Dermatophilus congolensis TaxID=1863 RepID=A0AA46GZV0_9MICO|nr:Uncharacterised protein [Dermatophilus congolensis]
MLCLARGAARAASTGTLDHMSTHVFSLAAHAPHVVNHLPMPAWVFGAIALAVGVLLLVFTWMFRHSAQAMIEGRDIHGGASHGHVSQEHGSAEAGGSH